MQSYKKKVISHLLWILMTSNFERSQDEGHSQEISKSKVLKLLGERKTKNTTSFKYFTTMASATKDSEKEAYNSISFPRSHLK